MDFISSIIFQLAALTQLKAAGGPLTAMTLHLFKNAMSINRSTVIASFTEADYTGYAARAGVTFGTPYIDPNGVARMDAPSSDWIMTDAVTPNTIYGGYYTDVAGTIYYGAFLLPAPIPLTTAGQGFSLPPTYAYGD